MGGVPASNQNELTRTIAERLRELWDAYLRVDEAAPSAALTKEYRAVHPDGTVHLGKPSAKEIAAAPIEDCWLGELQVWPTGEEAAIATDTAEVEVRSGLSASHFKFEVGEVWLREGGPWSAATTRLPCGNSVPLAFAGEVEGRKTRRENRVFDAARSAGIYFD